MNSPFVDSASSLPDAHPADPLEPSVWGRLLMIAVVIAMVACSAALLMR